MIFPVKISHVSTSTFPVNISPVNTTHVNCHSEASAQESSPLHTFTSPVNGLFSIKSSIISNHDLSPLPTCASHVDTLPVNHSEVLLEEFSVSSFIWLITSSNHQFSISSKLSKRKSLICSFCSAVHRYLSSIHANIA